MRELLGPVLGVGDVESAGHDITAVAGDLVAQRFQAGEIDVVTADAIPVPGERQCRRAPDTRPRRR